MATALATQSLDQLQQARTERALDALENGVMTVFDLPDGTWTVVSKGKTYTVAQNADEPVWSCTCPDFTNRCQAIGIHCKHIEAVCLTQSEASKDVNPYMIAEHEMEEHMHPSQSELSTDHQQTDEERLFFVTSPNAEHILSRLKQPLDMSRVKRRKAPGGGTVPYLEGYDVIEMANEIFAFHWSFDLLSEPNLMRWERKLTTYDQKQRRKVPLLDGEGQPITEEVGIAWITGKVTVQLGGNSFTHADVGRCIFTSDTPQEIDMAIAGAATDCLKRCFRQLGDQFGNVLYDKEVARTAGNNNSSKAGRGAQNPPKSVETKSSPPAQVVLKYTDGEIVDVGNGAELDAFKAYTDAHPDKVPPSRQALRAWVVLNDGGSDPD